MNSCSGSMYYLRYSIVRVAEIMSQLEYGLDHWKSYLVVVWGSSHTATFPRKLDWFRWCELFLKIYEFVLRGPRKKKILLPLLLGFFLSSSFYSKIKCLNGKYERTCRLVVETLSDQLLVLIWLQERVMLMRIFTAYTIGSSQRDGSNLKTITAETF